ncbi:uncharacterized protein V1516DRAFT_627721 [Lipomyces oligophaga]|uniref:uncharacterized protein n=1 Tax=Lipomyces oligophaga TaxID=45792 RepID=UPI0034CDB44E
MPTSLSPKVAALLAVTAIPPPPRPGHRSSRKTSLKRERQAASSRKLAAEIPAHSSTTSHALSPNHSSAYSSSSQSHSHSHSLSRSNSHSHSHSHSSSHPHSTPHSSHSSPSSRKSSKSKLRTSAELAELLTPPSVDDSGNDSSDYSLSSANPSVTNSPLNSPVNSPLSSPLASPSLSPPALSSSVSSYASSPGSSPSTPSSSDTEYFPVIECNSESEETLTIKSISSTSTTTPEIRSDRPEADSPFLTRHRKQFSESSVAYNEDPLCVAVDENGACIPAIAFVPFQGATGTHGTHGTHGTQTETTRSLSTTSLPNLIRSKSSLLSRSSSSPKLFSNGSELPTSPKQHNQTEDDSMVAKINSSLKSLKWLASSMARHQDEYMPKDHQQVERYDGPRRPRSLDRLDSSVASRQPRSSSTASSEHSSKRSRSQSKSRRLRSESVPIQQNRNSLSAGGVTARSTARALTMQEPRTERFSYYGSSTESSSPTSTASAVASANPATEGEQGEATYIQMDTYDIQQNCLPIIRPREPRMNGDFFRILAMELEMRRHGKLSPDFYSGKARMVLAPRSDYNHLAKKTRNWTPWTKL